MSTVLALGAYTALIWALGRALLPATPDVVLCLCLGAGTVALMLTHELGHYVSALLLGLPAQLPVFTWSGAKVGSKVTVNLNDFRLVLFTVAGPAAGVICGWLMLVVGDRQNSWVALTAALGCLVMQLGNLLPLPRHDGGDILEAILSPSAKPHSGLRRLVLAVTYAGLLCAAAWGAHRAATTTLFYEASGDFGRQLLAAGSRWTEDLIHSAWDWASGT